MKTLVESTEGEFRMQLAEVEAKARCGDCGNTATEADRITPPRLDKSLSWTISV
jgi:hypothetical protein